MAFVPTLNQARRNSVFVGLPTVAAVSLAMVLPALLGGIGATNATGSTGPGAMSLSVENHSGSCDESSTPTKCSLPLGSLFEVVVSIDEVPYNPEASEDGGASSTCSNGQDDGDADGADEKDASLDCSGYLTAQSFIEYGPDLT